MPSETPSESSHPFAQHPQDNKFFAWMRSLDLTRSPGWIGGVCAGVAQRIGIDPIIVRGIAVVVAVLGAPALLLYAAAWMLLPDHTGKIHAEEVGRGRFEAPVAGVGLLVLLSFLPPAPGLFWLGTWGVPFWDAGVWPDPFRFFWTLAVIASAIWLVVWLVQRSTTSAPAPSAPGETDAGGTTPNATPPNATTDEFTTKESTTADVTDTETRAPASVSASGIPAARSAASPEPLARTEDLTAWQDQQARYKQERDGFVRADEEARRAASTARAAEQKRLRGDRTAAYRAEQRATRSHPLYTLIAIGLALITGALVLLVVGEATLTKNAVLAGLASTLAVLALAIVVNGIMGKRSGGSSGLAVIITLALVLVAGIPWVGSRVVLVSDAEFSARFADGTSQEYVIGVGDTVIDLTGYWEGERAPNAGSDPQSGKVTVVMGAGNITVVVPDDEFVSVQSVVGWDRAATSGATQEFLPAGESNWNDAPRTLSVEAVLGAGNLTVTSEGDL